MRRITAGILAAAAGGSLLLTGGTAVAAAPPKHDLKVKITRITPDPVQVERHGFTSVKIDVFSKDAVRVKVSLKPIGFKYNRFPAKEARAFNRGDFKRFVARFSAKDPAGRWLATATAFDRSGRRVLDHERFTVELVKEKFDTRIKGWKVTPRFVRKGKSVYFRGHLLSEERRRFKGYDDQEVGIYFRPNHHREWKLVTKAETDRFGRFSAKARAYRSGEYRAVFKGNDEANGSESSATRVRVTGVF